MKGAIIGDIIGSRFERGNGKDYSFELFTPGSTFTDDTVMTVAVADWLMHGGDIAAVLRRWGVRYPTAGYGGTFRLWLAGVIKAPYNSWGNGSAMRVSPVGGWAETMEQCLALAEETAAVTHNHPEGIKGAQAVAGAIYMARDGASKAGIREWVTQAFGYDLERNLEDIRPGYTFDVSCQGSVPESIISFLEATDLEDAVRKAISLGGDTDTMACIAGGIAEAYYYRQQPMDNFMVEKMNERLPEEMKTIVEEFYQKLLA
ncbi:MAG: ADP-ribosylglycohydrolase family protein [Saprospiraceae bacterium]|nr:ADP-ribosylglycohydrolase family protein [Lewinella sp.]